MRELLFWGATGQARVLREAIAGTDLELVAIVDNRQLESPFPAVPLLHGHQELDAWLGARKSSAPLFYAVAIGGSRGRDRLMLMETLQDRGLMALTIQHRTAFVAGDASIGPGCQILAHAAVCACARLSRGVIVNTAASVDHDCVVANGAHLSPGVRLAGDVTVGACAFLGVGAIVLPRIRIGEDAVVGAGAVVIKDVPDGATVIGNPAHVVVKT